MTLREQIIQERKMQGMTQSDLAEKVGIRQATISDFEKGKSNLRFDILEKIINTLSINIMDTIERRKYQLQKSEELAKILIEKGVEDIDNISKNKLIELTNDSYISMLPFAEDKEYQTPQERKNDENTFEYFMILLKFDFVYLKHKQNV